MTQIDFEALNNQELADLVAQHSIESPISRRAYDELWRRYHDRKRKIEELKQSTTEEAHSYSVTRTHKASAFIGTKRPKAVQKRSVKERG